MNTIKGVFIAIGGVLSSLLGILYIPVVLMVLCNVIDYFTGIFAAVNNGKKISSATGIKGIFKKVCMWLLVIVGAIVDELIKYATATVGLTFPFVFLVSCIVAVWIICNELISILENISAAGVKVPGFLMKIVRYIKGKTEDSAGIQEEENSESTDK